MKDMDMNLFLVLDSRALHCAVEEKSRLGARQYLPLFGILAAVTKFTKRRKDL